MSMRKLVALVCAAVTIAAGLGSAVAKGKSLRRTYTDVRVLVVKKHGARAAGRNIRRFGVKTPRGTRPASNAELAKSIRVLRALVHPKQYLVPVGAGPPTVPPAGVMTARYAPTGKAACIVQRESGGDPTAANGQYHGIGQWSDATWRAHHGPQITGSSTPVGTTYQQQLQVLNYALATVGSGDWSPYDGC